MTDGGLVLLPPPHLQPANETCLTLVQTVHAVLQQLDTFLQTKKKSIYPEHSFTETFVQFMCFINYIFYFMNKK